MPITQIIREDMKTAMRAHETLKTEVLRGLLAAFTNELVSQKRKPTEQLTDDEALAVLKRAVKQRKDSIEQFTKGDRPELAEKESAELLIIEAYLPAQASEADIERVAREKIAALGITDKAKLGMAVGAVMKEFGGNADGTVVKAILERVFSE